MSALVNSIAPTDAPAVIAVLVITALAVAALQWRMSIGADAYLQGYQHGYQDGSSGAIAGVRAED